MALQDELIRMGQRARAASRALARLPSGVKNAALLAMADGLEDARAELQAPDRCRVTIEGVANLAVTTR